MNPTISMAITVVEKCQVSPSQGAPSQQLLPLLYFDMIWLPSPYTENLFFYDLQCSKSQFLENILVNLKLSLSLTLKHFLPLAGNIVFPLSSPNMPVFHYVSGDSVSLTAAVSSGNFSHLIGNHSRDADEFHDLVPQMPPATYSSDQIKCPVIAVQATLFPNQGICIGLTQHHAICDGANLFDGFVHKWASINKFNGDSHLVGKKDLPFYNRSNVQHAKMLDAIVWKDMKSCRPTVSLSLPLPLHKVRRTFILSAAEIKKLKNFVMTKNPAAAISGHVTSFMVASGYLWSCMAKSASEGIADDEPEYLTSPVDCRARLRPPLPENYFGNCLIFMRAESTHGKLKGKEAFVGAVAAIGEAIDTAVKNGRGIVEAFENMSERSSELAGKRWLRTAASPRFDIYGADYGWGSPIKFECIHIDFDGAVSFCRSRDGGMEMGLSMGRAEMEVFAAVFNQNLCINSSL